jgi:glutathione synthase
MELPEFREQVQILLRTLEDCVNSPQTKAMAKYLVVADPIETWIPRLDTTLRMVEELLRRGHSVEYCDTSQLDLRMSTETFLSKIPVRRVLEASPKSRPVCTMGVQRLAHGREFDVILQRKDPPVDAFYKDLSLHFARLPESILQINNPLMASSLSEHELPMQFPEISVPTTLCESADTFVEAIQTLPGESVAKPFDQCSGIGVEFFHAETPHEKLLTYWDKWQPKVIVQPFIEEAVRVGDLRVLMINGKILGQVLRVPKAGSRLANLHQGASAAKATLTKIQKEASLKIAHELGKKGLYFLGIDFLGDLVSEINITCPSALPMVNEVEGPTSRIEVDLIEQIEALRKSR